MSPDRFRQNLRENNRAECEYGCYGEQRLRAKAADGLMADDDRSEHVDRVRQDHNHHNRSGQLLFHLAKPPCSPTTIVNQFLNFRRSHTENCGIDRRHQSGQKQEH